MAHTRSLVLAGGGAKIGWASGALSVLLDEADMRFDHIDATSGSVFNLGMLLSGRTGQEVCDAWGGVSPREFVSLHRWRKYLRPTRLPSLLTQDAIVDTIMPKWGIDLAAITACTHVYDHPVVGTFNVCDFTTKRIRTFTHDEMTLDRFIAVDAVPAVVPPVSADGTQYVDAMLLQDANVLEAVRRGADEIWIIWTVDDTSVWKGGLVKHLGHAFEICALGNLWRELDEVERINEARQADGREPIAVHLLRPTEPVPVDYLFYRRRSEMPPIIETGREDTRRYLRALASGASAIDLRSAPAVASLRR